VIDTGRNDEQVAGFHSNTDPFVRGGFYSSGRQVRYFNEMLIRGD
jgi:hypothetical protein